MRIRGIGRLRRAAFRLRDKFAARALILLYHRVAELQSDPQMLAVTPQHFAQHLKIIRKLGHPIRLQQLVQRPGGMNVQRRAVVVTFDDGYADNLSSARPLLERFETPATVFVTTGYLGQRREFWWDELDRLLLQPGTLPEELRLSTKGSSHQWQLGEAAYYTNDTYGRHRSWDVQERHDPTPRQRIYRSLCQLLRPLPEEEQREVLAELQTWAGADSTARPTHRVFSPDEVLHLAEGGLVEVGAHTVTHSVLSALPADAQRAEIQGSKARLEEILGRQVASFAYPYGSPSDYTSETVAVVRDAGFACACANFDDVVWSRTDRFGLPRVLVRDWDGDEFARRLERWFRG